VKRRRRTVSFPAQTALHGGALEVAAEPVNVWRDPADPVPYTETKGAALVHILEELFQHLGQMEITRDALVAANRR